MKFSPDKLIQYRAQAQLTQLELADRCGVKKLQISRYESGAQSPRKTMIHRLAAALDCEYEDLLDSGVNPQISVSDAFNQAALDPRIGIITRQLRDNLTEQQINEMYRQLGEIFSDYMSKQSK